MRLLPIVLLLGLMSCGGKQDPNPAILLDSLPPDGRSKSFKDIPAVTEYFDRLSLHDKGEMIRRLKDKHPLVDSLKALLNEEIGNTFKDMLPDRFDTVKK